MLTIFVLKLKPKSSSLLLNNNNNQEHAKTIHTLVTSESNDAIFNKSTHPYISRPVEINGNPLVHNKGGSNKKSSVENVFIDIDLNN